MNTAANSNQRPSASDFFYSNETLQRNFTEEMTEIDSPNEGERFFSLETSHGILLVTTLENLDDMDWTWVSAEEMEEINNA
jgi:hypothetical protein